MFAYRVAASTLRLLEVPMVQDMGLPGEDFDGAVVRWPGVTGAVADMARGWELSDPRRDRATMPYTDAWSAGLIGEAVTSLVLMRAPMWLGDAGPTISVLVSLSGEAASSVFDAVADARDQGYTWDQIASRLATTPTSACRRYGPYSRWRRSSAKPEEL